VDRRKGTLGRLEPKGLLTCPAGGRSDRRSVRRDRLAWVSCPFQTETQWMSNSALKTNIPTR